jgi:hypothetical protein
MSSDALRIRLGLDMTGDEESVELRFGLDVVVMEEI